MQNNESVMTRLGLLINFLVILAFLILALRAFPSATAALAPQLAGPRNNQQDAGMGGGMGRGMGGGSAMMRFHQAEIPAEYAGLTNPTPADAASLERGQTTYQLYCVACHGESGMGDGAAGQALDPKPAPIAQSSQMMGDDYLFWRVSTGGAHFSTAMPAWEAALDDQTRWDLVNYMRSLGAGQTVTRGRGAGNTQADPAADMAAAGVTAGIVTQSEADTFLTVHALVEAQMATQPAQSGGGTMLERQQALLSTLVEAKTVTQEAADTFIKVRDQLLAAGVME